MIEARSIRGLSYFLDEKVSFRGEENDIIISADQKKISTYAGFI
jgi:hypothetical protein